MESPTFENDKSVKLHYKNGDDSTETTITFICKPGEIFLSDSMCRAFMQMRLRIEIYFTIKLFTWRNTQPIFKQCRKD